MGVGDERVEGVEGGGVVGLMVSGFEDEGVEVGRGMGLGEVDGDGLRGGDGGNERGVVVLVREVVKSVDRVLERGDVGKGGMGGR